jgi:hypothetical protein
MTALGWAVTAVLVVGLVWLGLAMAGLMRAHAALRARVEELEGRAVHATLAEGLPLGRQAPPWSIETSAGDVVTSESVAGRRHLLVFADPDCRACDELLPELARASGDRVVPPAVIVGRGDAAAIPPSWRSATVGVEHDRDVSDAFEVDVSPFLFVVDEGGAIVSSGAVTNIADVRELVEAGEEITIVRGADG